MNSSHRKSPKTDREKKFCEELRVPIYVSQRLFVELLNTSAESPDVLMQREIARQRQQKLDLLFIHYSIERTAPHSWERLAIALATDFVMGFAVVDQPPRGSGRPPGTTKLSSVTLAHDIEKIVFEEQVTARTACRRLATSKSHESRLKEANALYEQYRRHLKTQFDTSPIRREENLLRTSRRRHKPSKLKPKKAP